MLLHKKHILFKKKVSLLKKYNCEKATISIIVHQHYIRTNT
jgi:hypothetical protein